MLKTLKSHNTPGIKLGYENEKKCNFSLYENTKKIHRVLLFYDIFISKYK